MRTYLDHNATTPLAPAVLDAITGVLGEHFGNASSVHMFGQMAKAQVDGARAAVADLIGARPQEIVFTSGGTEADNLAIRGVTEAAATGRKRHLIASAIEHEAVLKTLKALGRNGWTTTLLPVAGSGLVAPDALESALTDETVLVSIMHANNEVGTVQPIAELAAIARRRGVLFHTDAVQSAGKLPLAVDRLGVDLLSLSAHKLNGPKGVGALWVRRGLRLVANQTGGGQERNRRGGTENVPGIAGFGAAARLAAAAIDTGATEIGGLRDRLEAGILANVPGTVVNGDRARRIPNTTNVSFESVEAESLLIALDLEGVAVSTGSACSSGTLEPSHVLQAMGCSPHRTQSSIRFSLGLGNTTEQIDHVIEILPRVVGKLRTLARPAQRVGA